MLLSRAGRGVVRGCVRQARADCAPRSGIKGYGATPGPCLCGAWGAKCATLNEKYRVRMKVTLFEFGNGHFRRCTSMELSSGETSDGKARAIMMFWVFSR